MGGGCKKPQYLGEIAWKGALGQFADLRGSLAR